MKPPPLGGASNTLLVGPVPKIAKRRRMLDVSDGSHGQGPSLPRNETTHERNVSATSSRGIQLPDSTVSALGSTVTRS